MLALSRDLSNYGVEPEIFVNRWRRLAYSFGANDSSEEGCPQVCFSRSCHPNILIFSALKQDVDARTKGKGRGLSERSSAKSLRNSILLKPSIDKTNPLLVLYPIQQIFSSVFYENCYIFFKQNFMHFVYILSFCCTSYT